MFNQQHADYLILNVDDNEGARYAKSRILGKSGFRVIEASNGTDAIAMANAHNPDLILLDTRLPDINGFEVSRRLKSEDSTRTILILQTSASFLKSEDKIQALEWGADNYLFEPIESEELIANVRALLRLSRAERALRDSNRRKDEFLATLAHELRNPLGPIRHANELLGMLDTSQSPVQEKARQIILRQTDHMIRLVDDLLDVSRISHGKIELKIEHVPLQHFIHTAIETSAELYKTRQHELRVSLPEAPVWIEGDPVRLAQIVTNLLNNAAKFTQPCGLVQLSAQTTQHSVTITIQDNGIGIAADNRDRIFELFTQAHHSNDKVKDGLGIGLSLVKTLSEMHGGTVGVESAGIGMGSTFTLQLPIKNAHPNLDSAPLETSATQAGTSSSIIIVDDNVDAAETLAAILQLNGHAVQIAHTGRHGLQLINDIRPQVIFLDIGLPDQSGYEVAKAIRVLAADFQPILIALTGYGTSEDKAQALAAGFDEHLVKPLDFEKISSINLLGPSL